MYDTIEELKGPLHMNKTTIIIVSFILLVLLGVGILVLNTEEADAPVQEQQSTVSETTEPAEELEAPSGDEFGDYVTYSDDAIAEADGQVVLFFHAVWCPQCLQLEQDIKQNGVPEGYTFIEVDFDEYQDVRQQYDVTVQTTLVLLDENGEKIDSYVPYAEPTLEAVQRDFLDA